MSTCKLSDVRNKRVRKAAIRGRLLSRQSQLMAQAETVAELARDSTLRLASDDADRAVESTDEELSLRILELRLGEIANIEEALQKVAKGTYGRCEWCGKRIPAARLALVPQAKLCVGCQKELERETSGEELAPEWERLEGGSLADRPEPHMAQLLADSGG